MEEKVLDAIRRMVIHGLYKTALTYGYGAEVFRAFKAEQVRLFDQPGGEYKEAPSRRAVVGEERGKYKGATGRRNVA